MKLAEIQAGIRSFKLDGWLLCDFRNREPFAYMILGLDPSPLASRRWYYFIPAQGAPVKLMSRVEPHRIDSLQGRTRHYTTWEELRSELGKILGKQRKKIAMQYSPDGVLPYVSTVDAGTIELVRGLGHSVTSSKDLLTTAIGRASPRGLGLLREAAAAVDKIRRRAFGLVERAVRERSTLTEYEVQQWILKEFSKAGLTTSSPPMVGVSDHPSDPHFETSPGKSSRFRLGEPLLIDLWAKVRDPEGVYFDSTWVGFLGEKPGKRYAEAFEVLRTSRDAAIQFVSDRLASGRPCRGFEIDRVARRIVNRSRFGKFFIHRTGHSITTSTHGEGVNIDDFETHDDRMLLRRSCFSIEPGIYIPGEFGVRTETTVAITDRNKVEVLGELQTDIVLLSP